MSPWSFSPCGCSWLHKRSNCHALCYDEQYMINNLGDDNAMSNIVDGGTWSSVLYRVPPQDTSMPVVVKKLQNKSGPVDASLDSRRQSEVNLLGRIGHGNIISLADWIRRDNFILIVYDHKENGSLHQWLHHDPAERVLDWPTRRAIAVAVAGGLCYLHHRRKSPIVHHNINSANILIDTGLKPKIAGFDFAQVNLAGPDQPVPIWELTTGNMFGYTAPEYATMVTTTKVDVYSLGMLLLELVTGRVANAAVADGHLATWAGKHCNHLMENTGDFRDVVDMAIPDRVQYLKEMATMFRLGVDCTTEKPEERPAMHKVHCRLRNRGH
ncbi:receptor protein-tyrosine kinase CEPR1 [Brachypodium distachyon]|uniref:Protein kinase domain-containing protein n=1 Tax=Brachypodium distachyon TaxID=15368 RepID=I1I1I0_BRADI|nr:receptor protein-tyrosine kinase CEPR1 [Brachypodium distachyon]XP_024316604.1 receptor protein-tyrosine kinase CEPR1 [Brachypodium distachyon]KQJ95362.1 hypothetical protein BRADI_3g16750v3 [Brachypodium distachyon]PNT66765.1 hypothetical protein BRADI_3g16750v3 [Brachypodium distachyon]|eukprot:XP_003571467.2 receptor protein-tyrosine kinase CEPR1 [Brachypodium distachyon]